MSKYGIFSGPYFAVFGLNMEQYLSVFSPNAGKYGPEKTPEKTIWTLFMQWIAAAYNPIS